MKRFMEWTYKRSKKKYEVANTLAKSLVFVVGYEPKKLTKNQLRKWVGEWEYRNDPFNGIFNEIYPLPVASVMTYGDCDDYAAKLYWNLRFGANQPFLITYFTYNITKCHTVVGQKLDDGTYNIYNWSKVANVPNIDAMKEHAVGGRKVFSTIFSRWDNENKTWFTVDKNNLLK